MLQHKKVLRARDLRDVVAGEYEDNDGYTHVVRSMDFDTFQALQSKPDDVDDFAHLKGIVRQLVPTLSESELGKVTFDGAKAITTLASVGIEAVEALYPNAVGPASQTSPA